MVRGGCPAGGATVSPAQGGTGASRASVGRIYILNREVRESSASGLFKEFTIQSASTLHRTTGGGHSDMVGVGGGLALLVACRSLFFNEKYLES